MTMRKTKTYKTVDGGEYLYETEDGRIFKDIQEVNKYESHLNFLEDIEKFTINVVQIMEAERKKLFHLLEKHEKYIEGGRVCKKMLFR